MKSSKPKRQQRTVGAIVKVPLENGFHTYARILPFKLAFYDARTDKDLSVEEIVQSPVLYVLCVYDSVITKGMWEKIGKKLPIEPHLIEAEKAPIYTQDILSNKYYIHFKGEEKEATWKKLLVWKLQQFGQIRV